MHKAIPLARFGDSAYSRYSRADHVNNDRQRGVWTPTEWRICWIEVHAHAGNTGNVFVKVNGVTGHWCLKSPCGNSINPLSFALDVANVSQAQAVAFIHKSCSLWRAEEPAGRLLVPQYRFGAREKLPTCALQK